MSSRTHSVCQSRRNISHQQELTGLGGGISTNALNADKLRLQGGTHFLIKISCSINYERLASPRLLASKSHTKSIKCKTISIQLVCICSPLPVRQRVCHTDKDRQAVIREAGHVEGWTARPPELRVSHGRRQGPEPEPSACGLAEPSVAGRTSPANPRTTATRPPMTLRALVENSHILSTTALTRLPLQQCHRD